LECKLISSIKSGDHDIFLGEVVHTKTKPDIMKEGIVDLSKIQPLLYMGKNVFATTADYIMRPKSE
jgi:flavin reductase (DIM6/NTAB) family NADH-FMN oxidoreductase RutF